MRGEGQRRRARRSGATIVYELLLIILVPISFLLATRLSASLTSLTDAQRMELAQKIKDQATEGQALIGPVEPIEVLEQEYAGGQGVDIFVAKAQWLRDVGRFIGEH